MLILTDYTTLSKVDANNQSQSLGRRVSHCDEGRRVRTKLTVIITAC